MGGSYAVVGGHLVSPTATYRADIVVSDGVVVEVADLGREPGPEDVDARGKWVLPGAIDSQVHFREPGLEWKEDLESGTRAAVAGGVTTVLEMPNTNPTTTTPGALAEKLSRADGRCWCDYGFFFGASTENAATLGDAEMLPGTPGIKLFAGSSTGSLLVEDEATIRQVFEHGQRPVAIHSEFEPRLRERKQAISPRGVEDHPVIRDAEAAKICTEMLLRLCRETGRRIHILHISTLEEVALIRRAKREGLPVTCEATPQHLTFSADDYATLGTRIQQNPPIRAAEHREAIWAGLREGLFDVFGSDHAPHTMEEKSKTYPDTPSGMPGVQTFLPVLLDWALEGRISIHSVVRMTSESPANLFGLAGKGRIAPGYDADFCLFNPHGSWLVTDEEMQSKSAWSPFAGRTLRGCVESTFVRGVCAWADGKPQGQAGKPARYTWK